MKRLAIFIAFTVAAVGGAFAQVPPGGVIGAKVIVASTGHVIAGFDSGSGFYDNYLYLDNDPTYTNPGGVVTPNWIFENHLSSPGDTVDLGIFTAGTELLFHVVSDTHGTDFSQHGNGTLDWFTGPASRNADGFAHAFVDSTQSPPLVGFEDLAGLGDALYEDIRYTFTNVRAVATPDAGSSAVLLGIAIFGLVTLRRIRG